MRIALSEADLPRAVRTAQTHQGVVTGSLCSGVWLWEIASMVCGSKVVLASEWRPAEHLLMLLLNCLWGLCQRSSLAHHGNGNLCFTRLGFSVVAHQCIKCCKMCLINCVIYTFTFQAVHMNCSRCKKSMMKGHTAYQKKGFSDVFCSKNCLFEMFSYNKPATKTCHQCHKWVLLKLCSVLDD